MVDMKKLDILIKLVRIKSKSQMQYEIIRKLHYNLTYRGKIKYLTIDISHSSLWRCNPQLWQMRLVKSLFQNVENNLWLHYNTILAIDHIDVYVHTFTRQLLHNSLKGQAPDRRSKNSEFHPLKFWDFSNKYIYVIKIYPPQKF